jgi:hypothetical protein
MRLLIIIIIIIITIIGKTALFLVTTLLRRFCQICRPSDFYLFGLRNNIFLQSKVVSLASSPQLGGLGPCIYVRHDRLVQLYSPNIK